MRALRNLLLILLVFAAGSCSEPTSAPVETDGASELPDLSGLPISPLIVDASAAGCGIPTEVGLMLGPDLRTGSVEVTNDDANLYVRYQGETGRSVLATALFAGSSASEIPTSRWGLPQILRFPYKSGHPRGTEAVIWQIPLTDLPDGDVVIAAFAQIGLLPSWAEGEPISPGRDWAMYFTYRIATCASGTVGPDGGRVTSADGNAILDIPAGALTEPVLITITPATVEEIQAHITELGWPFAAPDATRGPDSAAAVPGSTGLSLDANLDLLPTLAGIRPIPGTLWDFSPDGLRFQKSGTVTLRYRDEDLPPGTDEHLLGVWLINGVIPYDRVGTVDVVANTITAPLDHFSYGFVGFRETIEADLAISRSGASTDQVAPGEAVTYAATITNVGPGSVTDAFVLYQGFGDVVAGTLSAGCAEDPAPVFATVVIRCEVGAIAAGASDQAPPASFVPQSEGEFEVWIDPGSSGTTDPLPGNNRFTETYTAVAATLNADLAINAVVASSDTIELGLPVGFTATMQNFGPDTAPGAQVVYSMFGNAVAGPVLPGCTVASAPLVADVEITCIIGDLAAGAAAQAPTASFVPQGVGDFTVWVSSGSLATDPNAANNRQELAVAVLERQADLAMQSILDAPDPAGAGVPIVYTVEYVSAHAAQPVDGALIRLVHGGNATFVSASVDGCAPLATFVTCPAGTLVEGLIEGMTITLLPADGVDELVITATIIAPFPITDPDPSNNLQAETTTIGFGGSADLTIANLSESADPVDPGQSVTYRATLQNLGPNAVDDAVVYYQIFGDAVAGALNPACTQTSVPAVADVEIVCVVGTLDADSVTLAPPAAFVPQSPGTYTVWVSPGSSASDPNPANNRFETTVTASASSADLRIDQFTDSPDPVDAGDEVTYQIQAIAMGTTTAIDGAVLRLLFTGDAQYVRSSLACSPIAGGVGCPLGAATRTGSGCGRGRRAPDRGTDGLGGGHDRGPRRRINRRPVQQRPHQDDGLPERPHADAVGQVIQRPLPAGRLSVVAGSASRQLRRSVCPPKAPPADRRN
ncbi:MAG: hypothetical protein R2910_06125 [Gemmatimonadales bacterium]